MAHGGLAGLVASGLVLVLITRLLSRSGERPLVNPQRPFFLWDRHHVAARDSRLYLLATVVMAFLAGAALGPAIGLRAAAPDGWIQRHETLAIVHAIAIGSLAGALVLLVQAHWHRAVGFVPWAFIVLTASQAAFDFPNARLAALFSRFRIETGLFSLRIGMIALAGPSERFKAFAASRERARRRYPGTGVVHTPGRRFVVENRTRRHLRSGVSLVFSSLITSFAP